ncbi:restriction endonuclease subunit S [Eubacterium ventriosum]|uniref:Restriction endonuclease subunit S n=2 Tax=Eubacterium ventriosum TaxID=39496 RepID=A0A413R942_9FIRM|nr:restriction endonuclease subunit S [Eubacterium ventriosum]RHA18772.1 restriction endonuclease subunit S [Eubacterium ventriosum]
MTEWKECKISDIGTVVGGATPSTKNKKNYENGDIPWITPKDLSTFYGRYIKCGERNITKEGFDSCSTRLLPKNSVLFSSRAPIGYVAIAENEMCTNQGFKSVIPNKNIDSLFLYYLLKFNKDKIESMGSGTTFKEISGNTMKNIKVCIPSDIKGQKKIAEILGNIDDKIEKNREINNNLEQQTQAIFDSMFPNITNGENTIGDTITPKRGKGLLSKNAVFGNVPVVAGGLEPSTYHNTANTKAPVLAISASGANAGFVSLWNIPIWSSDSSFIDSSMTDDVYFWYVLLKKRQREIYDSQTGSAQPHIYPQHIAAMPISDLNFDDVRNYTSIVTPIFEMIGHNKDENARLATTRDTLLPKLMSGELDVSNI